uniref:Uncharacterized protein n=1 Tax=Callorhinchus milii TaxID=7868 RepID=A0A4W3IUV8_CALMI
MSSMHEGCYIKCKDYYYYCLSISHCMTGAGLATGLSLFSPHSCSPFLSKIPSLSPLTYHTFNGIHHLDMTISGLAVLRVGFL